MTLESAGMSLIAGPAGLHSRVLSNLPDTMVDLPDAMVDLPDTIIIFLYLPNGSGTTRSPGLVSYALV